MSLSYRSSKLNLKGPNKREEIRKTLVLEFLNEKPGKGRGPNATRYRYYVERIRGGRRIYLQRPAWLNKGFDFEIWVERFANGKDRKPSHPVILNDLRKKCRTRPRMARRLHEAINRVYRTEEPDLVLRQMPKITFDSGFSPELILKILKWMFIEQDLTYWNFSGRAMLRRGIDEAFRLLKKS